MDENAPFYPHSASWASPPPAPSHLLRVLAGPHFYHDYVSQDEQDFVSPHFAASEHYFPVSQTAPPSPHLASLAPMHAHWNAPDEQPQNASRPSTAHYSTLSLNLRAVSGRSEPIPQHDYAPSYGMSHAYEQDHVPASASHVAFAHQQSASPTDVSPLTGPSTTFEHDQEDEEMRICRVSPSPPSPPSPTDSDVPQSDDEEYRPQSNVTRKPAPKRKQAAQKLKKPQARSPAFSKKQHSRYQVYKARAPHVYYASEEEAQAEVQIPASPRPYIKKEERVVEIQAPSPRSSRSSSQEVPLVAQAPVGLRKKSFSSRAKTEGRFIEQLFSMLSDQDQYGDVIRWDIKGEVVVIAHKEARLASVLLDQFGHSNFSAFGRQHAVYGFKALEKGELATLEIVGVHGTKFADAKFCRAWRHKDPSKFNRNSTAEEVSQIMAIPSRARQAAAARREAENDRRLDAWTSGQKTSPRKRSGQKV